MAGAPKDYDPRGVGIQNSGVRLTNQRVVLTSISRNPGVSAAELSRLTRLAPQTVGAILTDLDEAELLRAGEVIRGRRGQPATPYFVNSDGAYSIGVEVGWRHLEAVLVNIGGQSLQTYRRDYDFPDARTIASEIGDIVRRFRSALPESRRGRLIALGLAAPGGIGRNVVEFTGDPEIARLWDGLDLREAVEATTGLPVQLVNDGNAACWAEFGAQPKPRPANLVYILISTFVGAGIIAESTLWEGPTGNSANLGSMLVTDRQGRQNFVHRIASIQALRQRLAAAGISVPSTPAVAWPWDQWEPHVSEWIADAAPALAKVLMNTAAVIEYDVAVLDGVMPAPVLDRLIDATRRRLDDLPTLTFDHPKLLKGHLGAAAPSIGAAYLPLFRRFFSRDISHLADAAD